MERRPYHTAAFDTARWNGFTHRPGDIFVCTPPKCGTTWMQAIVASLLWPDGDPPGPILTISPWIEGKLIPVDTMHAMLTAQTHRRFMKSHTPADGIPWFETAHYIFVARDGRDAFMSLCNHLEHFRDEVRDFLNSQAPEGVEPLPRWDGDVHAFFARWLTDDDILFRHVVTFWDAARQPNVLLVHYNDLKADLEREMRRVAKFLGVQVPTDRWLAVVERCTFETMRANGEKLGELDVIFEGGVKSFVFKGTNGRWRDVLTADELAAYRQRVAETLPPDAASWLEHGWRAMAA